MDSIRLIAPAKVNLFLHVTGKRGDGYHTLQSLVAFADDGDVITLKKSDRYSLTIHGNPELALQERNLVTQAIYAVAHSLGRPPNVEVMLQKNIPTGAGLGGGSTDAATAVKGLLQLWDASLPPIRLQEILLSLGADVPVCFYGSAAIMEGIGEIITPAPDFDPLYAVLVFPQIHCETAKIFKNFSVPFSPEKSFLNSKEYLLDACNDLTHAAIQQAPIIQDVLTILKKRDGCYLSRMSGSGSACFGLFDTPDECQRAKEHILLLQPNWWVRPVTLK